MKTILLLSLLCFFSKSYAQGIDGEMQATKENKVLITELMEVSKFETYFQDYCSKRIDFLGKEKGLTKEKIDDYKKKINFKEFLDYTIFYQFAIYTSEELHQMIDLCKVVNKGKKFDWVFISNPMLESNLELQIRQYMKD